MRTWGIAALALACTSVTGCSGGVPAPEAAPSATPTAKAIATDTDVPAQQVLALVPEAATILTVTDFARVRDQLGDDGHDPGALWARADASAPLLTRGMFRDGAQVSQADVLWEAHFTGGADGYVVRFADGADLSRLRPPPGAQLRDHLLLSGAATGAATWAAVPGIAELVPDVAESTYVQRGCLAGDTPAPAEPGEAELEPLDAYSVELGSTTATVRLGAGRRDLFTRMRLGSAVPAFAGGFTDGAADPSSGRIGYRLTDPVRAADLTLRQRLPFGVCAA